MSTTKFILLLSVCFPFAVTFSQVSINEQHGDKYYAVLAYNEAIEEYLTAPELSTSGLRKLADACHQVGNYTQCEQAYSQLVKNPGCSVDDLYNYASVLRVNRKYIESDQWIDKYAKKVGKNSRVESNLKNRAFLNDLLTDKGTTTILNLPINTSKQELSPAIYGSAIVFSAEASSTRAFQRRNVTNNDRFLDLYVVDTAELKLNKRTTLRPTTDKKFHESVACFTTDLNRVYFTRNSFKESATNSAYNLEIFYSDKDTSGKWLDPVAFQHNFIDYSVAHPSISADGKTLYFASNRPGGIGGVDIWKSVMISDTSWSTPVNLGPNINTEGDELFPFISNKDNLLYFASDGHMGIGGLDVFVANVEGNAFSQPMNLGVPINSSYDDFSCVIAADNKSGYLTSNRPEGKGDDDIYQFNSKGTFNFEPTKLISGVLKDSLGHEITGVTVEAYDYSDRLFGSTTTGKDGVYQLNVASDSPLRLIAKKSGYESTELKVKPTRLNRYITSDLKLKETPAVKVIAATEVNQTNAAGATTTTENNSNSTSSTTKGNTAQSTATVPTTVVTTATGMSYESVYFEYNSALLSKTSKGYLDGIVLLMNNNPKMNLDLKAFTDCRGDEAYNKALAQRRLDQTLAYLKKHLKQPERIIGVAVGEIQLPGCDCNVKPVKCNEDELQKDRRVEIVLYKAK